MVEPIDAPVPLAAVVEHRAEVVAELLAQPGARIERGARGGEIRHARLAAERLEPAADRRARARRPRAQRARRTRRVASAGASVRAASSTRVGRRRRCAGGKLEPVARRDVGRVASARTLRAARARAPPRPRAGRRDAARARRRSGPAARAAPPRRAGCRDRRAGGSRARGAARRRGGGAARSSQRRASRVRGLVISAMTCGEILRASEVMPCASRARAGAARRASRERRPRASAGCRARGRVASGRRWSAPSS